MSDTYYSAPNRWPMLEGHGLDEQQVAQMETRQRELEQYLGAPPQRITTPRFLSADGSKDGATSIVNFEARWERQRGHFVTFDFSGDGSGTPAANPTSLPGALHYGVALPVEAPPVDEGGFAPCAGTVHGRVNPGLIAEAAEPPTLWLRPDGIWVVAANIMRQGFGTTTGDYFRGHIWYLAAT